MGLMDGGELYPLRFQVSGKNGKMIGKAEHVHTVEDSITGKREAYISYRYLILQNSTDRTNSNWFLVTFVLFLKLKTRRHYNNKINFKINFFPLFSDTKNEFQDLKKSLFWSKILLSVEKD